MQSLQEEEVESQCRVVEHLEEEGQIHRHQEEVVGTDQVEEVENCSWYSSFNMKHYVQ